MLENMYSIFDRIDEIKNRFTASKIVPWKNITPKSDIINSQKAENKNFDAILNDQITNENISDNNQFTIPKIKEIAKDHAIKSGISPSLVDAVIKVESGFNPNAVSEKGASGLMQLMPVALKQLGIPNPFNIEDNIKGGVSILKHLLQKYNWDLKKTLAAYNAGEAAVDKNNGVPPYKETRQYVKKVIDAYMQNIGSFK